MHWGITVGISEKSLFNKVHNKLEAGNQATLGHTGVISSCKISTIAI